MGNNLGVLGEKLAVLHLENLGYEILECNFSSRFGEIDIIAKDKKYLCFVEVKTRGANAIARPMESVTPSKQRKIIKTAEYYIVKHQREIERNNLQPRFDCIEVYLEASKVRPQKINFIQNAFS